MAYRTPPHQGKLPWRLTDAFFLLVISELLEPVATYVSLTERPPPNSGKVIDSPRDIAHIATQ